jgi:hypothetical protein
MDNIDGDPSPADPVRSMLPLSYRDAAAVGSGGPLEEASAHISSFAASHGGAGMSASSSTGSLLGGAGATEVERALRAEVDSLMIRSRGVMAENRRLAAEAQEREKQNTVLRQKLARATGQPAP